MRRLLLGLLIGLALGAGSVAFAGSENTPAQQHAKLGHQIATLQSSVADLETEQATEMDFLRAINRKIDTLCSEHAHLLSC